MCVHMIYFALAFSFCDANSGFEIIQGQRSLFSLQLL